jgi:hypothetical protein
MKEYKNIKLYLLKCGKEYLKKTKDESYAVASLEKATVFVRKNDKELNYLKELAILSGLKQISLVRLVITEEILQNY